MELHSNNMTGFRDPRYEANRFMKQSKQSLQVRFCLAVDQYLRPALLSIEFIMHLLEQYSWVSFC